MGDELHDSILDAGAMVEADLNGDCEPESLEEHGEMVCNGADADE